MLTDKHREDLKVKGYTVVESVLSAQEADNYRAKYENWLALFKDEFPYTAKSLIHKYNVGHREPSWAIRLKAKHVFKEVWGTDKLLSSFDAVAVGRPPESSEEEFHSPGRHWLHIDQGSEREGLHAYQGAVYLETCEEDDWTFEVIEGSHEYHDRYYEENDYAVGKRRENPAWRFKNLRLEDIEFFAEHYGLERKRVPVPKGGMVLWDSRLIHANTRPKRGRKNPDRWRYVVFVCMTPAKWADESSLKAKQDAYKNLKMTTHWPSDGVNLLKSDLPPFAPEDPDPATELPPSAKTEEAQRLAGILPYESLEEDDDVMEAPRWRLDYLQLCQSRMPETLYWDPEDEAFYRRRKITLSVFAACLAFLFYYWLS